eukprot:4678803-Amphidinium_carterae.1
MRQLNTSTGSQHVSESNILNAEVVKRFVMLLLVLASESSINASSRRISFNRLCSLSVLFLSNRKAEATTATSSEGGSRQYGIPNQDKTKIETWGEAPAAVNCDNRQETCENHLLS